MRKTILHIIILLLLFSCKGKTKKIEHVQKSEQKDTLVIAKNIESVEQTIQTKPKIIQPSKEISVVYVTAENGLTYREKPDINSVKLGKFELGSKLFVVDKTGRKLEIKDEQKTIKGEWIKVISERYKWHSGYVFSGFVVDSTKADFSKIPIDYGFIPISERKRAEVKFEKLNLLLTKINFSEFKKYNSSKGKSKSELNRFEPLKSVGNPQEGGYFLIKTDKNIFKFPCGKNYSRPCYIYENYIPSINSYSIGTLGDGMAESFLLDRGNNSTLHPVYEYDHGGFGLNVSPLKKSLIVYSSIDYEDYKKYYDFKSYIVVYDIKGIDYLSDIKNAYVFTTDDWQINRINWINNSSFVLEVFDKTQSDENGKRILTNIRYLRGTIK